MFTRKTLFLALCAALLALAWNTVSTQEKVMLHVSGTRDDYYARIWVVEAKPYLWIRADSPRRRWLEPLREYPNVYLWRDGDRRPYHAVIWEDAGSSEYVDQLFREKYGYVDLVRSLLRRSPSIPIRLDPL
jgi:hypothetical protein